MSKFYKAKHLYNELGAGITKQGKCYKVGQCKAYKWGTISQGKAVCHRVV